MSLRIATIKLIRCSDEMPPEDVFILGGRIHEGIVPFFKEAKYRDGKWFYHYMEPVPANETPTHWLGLECLVIE